MIFSFSINSYAADDLSPTFITIVGNKDISGGKCNWKEAKKELDKRYKLKKHWWKISLRHDEDTMSEESEYLILVCVTHLQSYDVYKYYADRLSEDYKDYNLDNFDILEEDEYISKLNAYKKLVNTLGEERVLIGDTGFDPNRDMLRFHNLSVHHISDGLCSGFTDVYLNLFRKYYKNSYEYEYGVIFSSLDEGTTNKYYNTYGGSTNPFYENYCLHKKLFIYDLEQRYSLYRGLGYEAPDLLYLNKVELDFMDFKKIMQDVKNQYNEQHKEELNNIDSLKYMASSAEVIQDLEIKLNSVEGYSWESMHERGEYRSSIKKIREIEDLVYNEFQNILNVYTSDLSVYNFDEISPSEYEIKYTRILDKVPDILKTETEKKRTITARGKISLNGIIQQEEYELIKALCLSQQYQLVHMNLCKQSIQNGHKARYSDRLEDVCKNFGTYKYIMGSDSFLQMMNELQKGKFVKVSVQSKNSHSLLGYKLEQDKYNPQIYYLSVADSNYPCNSRGDKNDYINELKLYWNESSNSVYSLYNVVEDGDSYIDNTIFMNENDEILGW